MKSPVRSVKLRTLSTILAVILALPLSWKGLTGFYTWLSPFIMLNSTLALKSFVWLNLAAFVVLIFIILRKRWFCNNLCPAGWCFDKVSAINKRKPFKYTNLPNIGKWVAVVSIAAATAGFPLFMIFDPLTIFNGFFTVFNGKIVLIAVISFSGLITLLALHLFFPGIWCARLCPLGGFQFVAADFKTLIELMFIKQKQNRSLNDLGRRYFLMSGIGLIGGIVIPKFLRPDSENIIRPPGTVESSLLYSLCSRCGSCNKVCPTGIIVPHTGSTDILSWMTPIVSFKSGYCLETCNLCSRVCPTGAITLFSIGAKSQLYIGTAEVQLENCLLFNNTECIKCKESCKYDALDFVSGESYINMMPLVNKDKCIGCGACEVVCPVNCIRIKGTNSFI